MARDKDGNLFLYLKKPIRGSNYFVSSSGGMLLVETKNFSEYGLNTNDFKDLKLEDEHVEVFINMQN